MQAKQLLFFSTPRVRSLAAKIARSMHGRLSPLVVKTFADGETYVNIPEQKERIVGKHVVLFGSGAPHANDRLMELLLLLDVFKAYQPKTITLVLSFYPYRRQERTLASGEAVSARVVAQLLEHTALHRLVLVELHTPAIKEFFSLPTHEVTTLPLFLHYFKKKIGRKPEKWVIIAPDHGITKACLFLAGTLGIAFLQSYKRRDVHDQVVIDPLRGDVRGKNVILLDDEINTGRTMLENVHQIEKHSPKAIFVAATHGIFSADAPAHFMKHPLIREVVVTDTILQTKNTAFSKRRVLSLAPLLTKELSRLFLS